MQRLFSRTALALAVVSTLGAAGCSPIYWVRPDTPPAQLAQDLAQCRDAAWREAAWREFSYRPFDSSTGRDVHHPVWVSPYAAFSDPFFEETRLAEFCMRAKGYALVPAHDLPLAGQGSS